MTEMEHTIYNKTTALLYLEITRGIIFDKIFSTFRTLDLNLDKEDLTAYMNSIFMTRDNEGYYL